MRRWCAGEGGLHAPSCLLPRTDQVHPYPTTKSQSGNLVRRADVVMGLRGGSGRACGGEKGYSGKAPGTSPKNLHDVRMLRTRQKTQTGVLHALLLLALLSMDGSVGEQRQDLTPLQCDTEGLQRSSEDACSAVIEESFKNESTGVGPFIKGGKTAELERFPYFVRLLKQASLEHACGGILIDAWHVLTAAHCQNSTGNNPLAYVGRMQEFVGVKTMILHPKWNGIVADGHDIALARLLRSVENVKFPVLSPPKTKYIHGTVVSALGWNESMDWWNPRAIDIADTLWVVDHDRCYGDVKKDLKPGMICAYSWKMRPCPGDSGGPLLIAHDDAGSIMNGNPQGDIVIGIVSFGSVICDTKIEHLSTAYTDVSEYALWIQEVKNSWNPEVFWLGGAVAIVAIVCTCYKCQDNPTQPDVPAHCGNRPLQRSVLVRQTTQDSLRGVAELFRDSYMGVAALQELPAQVLEPVSIGVARAMLSRRQKRMPNHFVTVSGKVQAIMDLLRLPATTTVALSGMGGVEDKEGEQWRDAVCHMHGLVREMGIIAAKGDLPDMHNIALSLPISTDERDHAQCTHSLILREYLIGCSNLKALPGDATWLSQLQRLDIDGCCELEKKFGQNDRPGKGYRTFTRVLTLKQYFVRAFTRPIPKSRYQTPCRVDRLREWRDAFGRKGKKGKGVLLQRSPPVRTQQHYAQLQRSTVLPQDTFQEWLEAIGVKPRRANAATPTLQQSPPLRSRK
eukprot:evm.model.scf_279.9 EVM.evm.TU.scf_279.9   scf_279:84182-94539(+)